MEWGNSAIIVLQFYSLSQKLFHVHQPPLHSLFPSSQIKAPSPSIRVSNSVYPLRGVRKKTRVSVDKYMNVDPRATCLLLHPSDFRRHCHQHRHQHQHCSSTRWNLRAAGGKGRFTINNITDLFADTLDDNVLAEAGAE